MAKPSKFTKKYWEVEEPKVISIGNNVLKLFNENGKIQVFPKVPTAPNGIGRGATLDIEGMTEEEHQTLIRVIQYGITEYGKNKSKQS